jgi:hypothetical protein
MPDYRKEWYYMEPDPRGSGFSRGPFTHAHIRELIGKGTIDNETQLRCGLHSYWHPLKEISAIFAKPLRQKKSKSVRSVIQTNKREVALVVITTIATFVFAWIIFRLV